MGWIPISALGLRMVDEVVHVPSDSLLRLQTPVAETGGPKAGVPATHNSHPALCRGGIATA